MEKTLIELFRQSVLHYQDRIDSMYTPEGKNPFNLQNMTIVSRMEE